MIEWTAGPLDILALARIEAGMCPAGHPARRIGDWMQCVGAYGDLKFQLQRGDVGQPVLRYSTPLTPAEWATVNRAHNEKKFRGEIPADDREAVFV